MPDSNGFPANDAERAEARQLAQIIEAQDQAAGVRRLLCPGTLAQLRQGAANPPAPEPKTGPTA